MLIRRILQLCVIGAGLLAGCFISLPAQAAFDADSTWEAKTVATPVGSFSVNVVSINLKKSGLQIKSLTTVSGERLTQAGPVQPLASFIGQAGGFAGINGSYFCPADYASCRGIEGSYYWLWYNSLTGQFANSYQNQFNQGPVIVFDGLNRVHYYRLADDFPGKAAFEERYGTTLQAAISNGPGLMFASRLVVTPDQLDTKQRTVKSNRSGIGFKGDRAYLLIASQATVMDLGYIMQALGMENAMNLDGGGSSALYYDGRYRVGPGRNIPNALVFSETPAPVPQAAEGFSFFAYDPRIRGGYAIASGNVTGDKKDEIITGTAAGLAPQVRVFDSKSNVKAQFFAFDSSLRNGVTVSACDVNNDGYGEIVTAQGRGGWPLLKIFKSNGTKLREFYVLDGKFTGGVNLACGDTNGDGTSEIVVAAMRGGGPHVLVYTHTGKTIANFMAYDQGFRGGINVSTIDMDGDGRDEIVTGPQTGAPHIQIFQIRPTGIKRLSPGFYAFSENYRGGVSVSGVDTNGDGKKELLVGVGDDAQPLVRQYNIRAQYYGRLYAYGLNFLGGVNLAGGDVDGDGADEILAIPRGNGGPSVRVIEGSELEL